MRARKRNSLYRIILALGIALPSFIGILIVQAKAVPSQPSPNQSLLQAQETLTPTAPLLPPTLPPPSATFSAESSLPTPSTGLSSNLYAFIQAPTGTVSQPYVILTAFTSLPRTVSITIRGFVNTVEFICTQSPCAIPLQSSSRLVFAAYADTGESSETVIASVSVTRVTDGYLVTIDSVSQFNLFNNSCSLVWGVSDTENVTWDDFVQFPYELHTKKTLHTLATHLLLTGIVDARDCPAGGLSIGLNWPTACGLERARPKMIEWQNQFDDYIWLASKNQGIPPKILKTLIEIESQFWPGNARFYLDEFGLGQVNQLGVDVLLRKDPTLYQSVCKDVLSDCLRPYQSLAPDQQAMIRGAVVNLMDATCPDCANGLDLNKAKESVSLLSKLFKANCEQVDYILSLARTPDRDVDAATATAAAATLAAGGTVESTTYEDLWRFTFLSYHSGMTCFQQAVDATRKAHQPFTWENIEKRLKCKGAADYVNGFMGNLRSFDLYLLEPASANTAIAAPTIIPTRTPVPTPTVFISTATVRVQVFIDRNGNKTPDEGEWIDAMTVLLETSTNQQISKRTQNGIAIFDMSGYTPGIGINVSLPGLYRNERFELPQQGEVTVTFMFEQPPLPTVIP
ncbi:MAG TPA: hypothetical protein VK206_12980 [Anaerolineales bacterium]|nr:hypothetical protein [Anaerolineales bacterium]